MNSSGRTRSGKDNFILRLLRGSVILSLFDRFSDFLRRLVTGGLLGKLFTGYSDEVKGIRLKKGSFPEKVKSKIHGARLAVCRGIENSFILNKISEAVRALLTCRLKLYGIFLSVFSLFTLLISIIKGIYTNTLFDLLENISTYFSLALIVCSIPLLFSKKTLGEGLTDSYVGRLILIVTNYSKEELCTEPSDEKKGSAFIAVLLALILSAVTFFVPPYLVIGALLALAVVYLVFIKPEIGVMALFALVPWLPTMVLAGIVIFTTVAFAVKLFRGKRTIKTGHIDVAAFAFLVLILFGGLISLSSGSLKPALLMVCLMIPFFLVSHFMISGEWLARSTIFMVLSATLNSAYGIIAYRFGIGYSSKAWLDSEMFDNISGRAVSTLENPNMLGEYLILIIPVVVAMFIANNYGVKRMYVLLSGIIMSVCLVLTWSRGAWIALAVAIVILLIIWHRRSIWLIIVGGASLPFLLTVLPESIVSRITSIGNMADSSTSYRVYIWQSSLKMIRDNLLAGIGIGEDAWSRVYPMYAYMGVEAAPHSHNLYFQIMLDLGILGFIVFLIFLFMLLKSSFTSLSLVSSDQVKLDSDITVLGEDGRGAARTAADPMKKTKLKFKMSVAGPLCGIAAMLIQGLTDYSWYNYRLFLMFWLMCGLAVSCAKYARRKCSEPYSGAESDKTSCDIVIS